MIPGQTAAKPEPIDELARMGAKAEPLGRAGLQIFQLPDSFRFGEEQVCLAHFASEQIQPRKRLLSARGEKPLRIVDPGSGSGILTLLLSALIPGSRGLAVELMDRPFTLLEANLEANGLFGRFQAEQQDLRRLAVEGIPDELQPASFDLVVANPPYFVPGRGPVRDDSTEGAREIAAAREERHVSLAEYLQCCAAWLAPGGVLTMLHRPDRLTDVLRICNEQGLTVTLLRAITPHAGDKPSAFLLAAKKQPGAGFLWQRDLIVRREDGTYTDELRAYYQETESYD